MQAHKEPVSSNYPDRCREADANYEVPSQPLDWALQVWSRNYDDTIASTCTECFGGTRYVHELSEATIKKESSKIWFSYP